MSTWISRRCFLRFVAGAPLAGLACAGRRVLPGLEIGPGTPVNDVYSGLNPTLVARVLQASSTSSVQRAIAAAREAGAPLAICGGRHSMGGQEFLSGGWLLDTRSMSHVRHFDVAQGLLEVDAGIEWPELIDFLSTTWDEEGQGWTIRQKQTDTDRVTIGGTAAANAHGNALLHPPFVADLERIVVVDHLSIPRTASRDENVPIFRLAVGGYGLFGVITEATLRLVPRLKVQRVVAEEVAENVAVALRDRATAGHLHGEFQFSVDRESYINFLRKGVVTSYLPVSTDAPIEDPQGLSENEWRELFVLAHTDAYAATRRFIDHYHATDGRIYWSDLVQVAGIPADVHRAVDAAGHPGNEVPTELYVPRGRLADFMAAARAILRGGGTPVIYGAVRFVEPDDVTFLPWAVDRWACVVFHLHVAPTPEATDRAAGVVRELIDEALERSGSFHLAYHRWATREQIQTAYPGFEEFLRLKRFHDPEERFQSDWYRHMRGLFA